MGRIEALAHRIVVDANKKEFRLLDYTLAQACMVDLHSSQQQSEASVEPSAHASCHWARYSA
jgi:hypothetical protein